MKVLLINPPIDNMITTNLPSYVDEQRGYGPPLGLMYVAAYAQQETNHEIGILDMLAEEVPHEQLITQLKKQQPDLVGITATTFTLIDAIMIARAVKAFDKRVKVVLGGPHVHIYPEETIRLTGVDFVVTGEGELPFTRLLQHMEDGKVLAETRGLVFRHQGSIINSGPAEMITDLDSLPFPARDLTDISKYNSLIGTGGLLTTMMTSRGCPYKCLFCDRPHLGKKFRARSAENVVDEMEECVSMGIREILIYDDTFTIDKQRVMDICSLISGRHLKFTWDIRTRVDTVDSEMLKALKNAGCARIHYGIESANPEILKILQKGITLPQVEAAFKMTRDAGIQTLAYFMLGSPNEKKEQIIDTIDYARKLGADYCHFSVTTPYPATPLYNMGIKKGLYKDYWREFAANPNDDFTTMFWEENLDRAELIQLLDDAYKSFYTRPGYVLRQIGKVRSFKEFARKAKAGLKLLKL